ncbi:MAG: hemolysin family protein [Candidatus Omnitrophica bacterium]|nr:hemolysin family protein [Candidatus Omnitrophota bacterium]
MNYLKMDSPEISGAFLLIVFLLFLSAFFSASEAALISLGTYHRRKFREGYQATNLDFWFQHSRQVLITILVGNNIVNVALSVVMADVSYRLWHRMYLAGLVGVVTFFLVVFGEIIPKTLGKKHAEWIAPLVMVPLRFVCVLLKPITWLLIVISDFFLSAFGLKAASIFPVITEDDLRAMIAAGEEEGVIEKGEHEMIHSIFEISDTMVREIMTPRVSVVAVEETDSLAEVLDVIAREGYSRLPVYREDLDHISGIVYIKDALASELSRRKQEQAIVVRDIMRPAFFVPETNTVREVIQEMQHRHIQMAIVVDEYGGTAGLVTMEDLLEEIVGEISDEYKKERPEVQRLPDGSCLVKGALEIEKANEFFGLGVSGEKVNTLGGFILDYLGRFPQKGERFRWRGYQFIIQEADSKTIHWVRIKKVGNPTEAKYESGRDLSAKNGQQDFSPGGES